MLGESHTMSGEAASRSDIRLPECQRQLAEAIHKIGKPCVLITFSGRPLDLSWEASRFATILHAWAPGTEGGNAIADVVFGDFSPVGKLTMGFPRNVGQLPMTYREKPTGRPFDPTNSYSSRYLDVRNDALFPFGHGLTYAEFTLSPLTLSSPTMAAGEIITVSIEITNTSSHPATETLQLYLRDCVASVSRPTKELRGFQRVSLAAHESRAVTFEITDGDLAFPGRDLQPTIEPGEFDAMVGPNSRNLQSIRFRRI
jgi:beta-glucosidase